MAGYIFVYVSPKENLKPPLDLVKYPLQRKSADCLPFRRIDPNEFAVNVYKRAANYLRGNRLRADFLHCAGCPRYTSDNAYRECFVTTCGSAKRNGSLAGGCLRVSKINGIKVFLCRTRMCREERRIEGDAALLIIFYKLEPDFLFFSATELVGARGAYPVNSRHVGAAAHHKANLG